MEILANETLHKVLFVLWIILLVPWLPFAPLSAMAFDAGPNFWAYLFVGSFLTYPITVLTAFVLYQKKPRIAFLPFLNVGVLLIGAFLESLVRQPN
jgi:hypothetical protein